MAVQYRELLQMVMHNLVKPSAEGQAQLGTISTNIAQCVKDLVEAAQNLKDRNWVDPSDPTIIAENELLRAAQSIEAAATKLASLQPRTETRQGQVRLLSSYICVLSAFCRDFYLSHVYLAVGLGCLL